MIKKLIDRSALVIFFILAIGILLVQTSATARDLLIEIDENKLFNLVQTWRTKSDLPIYKKSERLCDVAAVRLKKVKVSFSHDGFIEQAVASDWYGYNGVAENLVRGFHSEQDSLDGWLGSPKHLENLEKPFTESCIKCDKNTCIHIFGGY